MSSGPDGVFLLPEDEPPLAIEPDGVLPGTFNGVKFSRVLVEAVGEFLLVSAQPDTRYSRVDDAGGAVTSGLYAGDPRCPAGKKIRLVPGRARFAW